MTKQKSVTTVHISDKTKAHCTLIPNIGKITIQLSIEREVKNI
ncbi:hypothetical protein [Floricoccus penangensis]|nr:hypothetical protein [Floricoccus penangensis]